MQIIIDNILLNYEVFGDKDKKPILILHGWKNSIKNWEQVAVELSKKNKVVLVDLPGFGNSSIPKKQPFDTYDYAEIINKFITKLNLKDIVLAGHSFGGKISVIVSTKNNSIKKLVLIDISGINKKNLTTNIKTFLYSTIKIFLPRSILKNLSSWFSSEDYKSAGSLIDSFKKIVTQDISSEAKKINVSTLIIWGENDKDVPLSSAKTLRMLIPNSTLRIVWRAGHHPHIEKPEKFLEIIKEFV